MVETRSDGAYGNGEHLGDLFIRKFVLEFEHQCLALRWGELGDRRTHRLEAGVFAGSWRGRWLDQLLDRFPPAKRIQTNVTRDAKKVGALRHRTVKPVSVPESAHKCILEEILGCAGQRRLVPEIGQQGWPRFAVKLFQLFNFLVHQAVFPGQNRRVSFEYVGTGAP